jgi:hypothetical protein
VQTIS